MSKNRAGFAHIEHYPYRRKLPKFDENGRKVRAGVRSAISILAEADRAFASTPHIAEPLAPTLIFGVNPLELAPELHRIMDEARSKGGRRLRKDSKILLAGVASFPSTVEEVSKDAALLDEYNRWLEFLIRFLKKQWPEELRSVVVHQDEKQFHAHWYAVVRMEGNVAMINDLHPGKRASYATTLDAKAEPVLMKARRDAYKQALRSFQGDYYAEVGAPLGHAKYNERKPRVPYSTVLALRSQEENLRTAWQNLIGAKNALVSEEHEMENDRLLLAAEYRMAELQKIYDERERQIRQLYRDKLIKWSRWAQGVGMEIPSELGALLKSPT